MVDYPKIKSGEDLLPLIKTLEGSGDNETSSSGAIGRYQITPDTAKRYGFDPAQLKDPAYNESVAKAVLNDLYKKFDGNVQAMLVGYNAGPTVGQRFVNQPNRDYIPPETQKYLSKADALIQSNKFPGPVNVAQADTSQLSDLQKSIVNRLRNK